MVQQSLMNDEQLKEFREIAIQEPRAWETEGSLVVAATGHANSTKVLPTTQGKEGWAIRSMI